MKVVPIAVGCDPELFLKDTNGLSVSAEGLVGGSKAKPLQMSDLPEGFCIQEDNVAMEFNIPPCSSPATFNASIAKALSYCGKVAKAKGLSLCYEPALHFSTEVLSTPHARRLGCDPDFNAWTMEVNQSPTPPRTMRTAAGHIHVSWEKPKPEEQQAVVQALDLFLTVPSILATPRPPVDLNRRSLYGRAGACRPKPYGVEARSLDNFWVKDNANRKFVYNGVIAACEWLSDRNSDAQVELQRWSYEIQDAINTHDKDLAIHIMDTFNLADFPVRIPF